MYTKFNIFFMYLKFFSIATLCLLGSILFANNALAQNGDLTDLALRKKATEKAVRATHVADWAVDGNDNTSAIVEGSKGAWWQVDLGARYEISKVKIVPKWAQDLRRFYIIFSDNPLPENTDLDFDLEKLEKFAVKVLEINNDNPKGYDFDLGPGVVARYMRIQRKAENGADNLDLISVNVLGKPQQVSGSSSKDPWPVNLALGKKAAQARDVEKNAAGGAVDLNPATAAISRGSSIWWQVDLGAVYNISDINININWPKDLNNFYLLFFDNPISEIPLDLPKNILEKYAVKVMEISEKEKAEYKLPVSGVKARYVRIQRKEKDGDGNMDLRKFEVIGDPREVSNHVSSKPLCLVDLASGKTATQSTTEKTHVAALAVDKDPESQSITTGENGTWWQVDLGQRYDISGINFTSKWADQVNNCYVLVSDFPFPDVPLDITPSVIEKYMVKSVRVSAASRFQSTYFSEPVTGRYIRIQQRYWPNNPLGLLQVSVLGDPIPSAKPLPNKLTWDEFRKSSRPYDLDFMDEKSGINGNPGTPEIIGCYKNNQLTICLRDYFTNKPRFMKFNKSGNKFERVLSKDISGALQQLGGFTTDGDNYYFFTAIKESQVRGYVNRPNIIHMLKLNPNGDVLWNVDLNTPENIAPVYVPLWGTAGIAYGAGKVGLICASAIAEPSKDGDQTGRHMAAFRMSVNANDGSIAAKGAWMWGHHCMNERIVFDGEDFAMLDYGDYGFVPACAIYALKLRNKDNWNDDGTGNVIYPRAADGKIAECMMSDLQPGDDGYTTLIAASKDMSSNEWQTVVNLAALHIVKNFSTPQKNFTDTSMRVTDALVDTRLKNPKATGIETYKTKNPPKKIGKEIFNTANGIIQTTGIAWLTNYTDKTVRRPRLYKLSKGKYVAIWELWETKKKPDGNLESNVLSDTRAMLLDEYGNVLVPEKVIGKMLIPQRDELFDIDGKGCWLVGHREDLSLSLFSIDENLNVTETKIDL